MTIQNTFVAERTGYAFFVRSFGYALFFMEEKMKGFKKLWIAFSALVVALFLSVALVSCVGEKGEKGEQGEQGVGITGIEKVASEGNEDVYMIIFSDGTTTKFTVTNGEDGVDGTNGKDGTNGRDGIDGTNGKTPYIGNNGNWWIGNNDTGVSARAEVCTCDGETKHFEYNTTETTADTTGNSSNTGSGNGLTVETDPNGIGSIKPIPIE